MPTSSLRTALTFVVGGALSAALFAGISTTRAQVIQQPQGTQTGAPHISDVDPALPAASSRQEQMRLRLAEDERHRRMVDDADKLLELITELRSDVDKSTKYETSVDAIKKAAEIEKLAHDVRERMRN